MGEHADLSMYKTVIPEMIVHVQIQADTPIDQSVRRHVQTWLCLSRHGQSHRYANLLDNITRHGCACPDTGRHADMSINATACLDMPVHVQTRAGMCMSRHGQTRRYDHLCEGKSRFACACPDTGRHADMSFYATAYPDMVMHVQTRADTPI
jgi:hypothetical protein